MTQAAVKKQQKQPLEPITDAMRKKAADILKKAKVQLAINHPFFGQIVLNRKVTLSDTVSTAYVTPKGNITIGVRFLHNKTVQQGVFLLAHEAMHYALLHPLRRSFRKHKKWNYACDAVINDTLKTAGVGEFIDGGVDMPGSKDKTSEKVYDDLPDNKGKDKGGYQPGEGFDDLEEGDDDGSQLDESQASEIEQQVKQELATAAQVAKMQGKLPAGLERLIDEIVNPPTPWHILLERYMTHRVKGNSSWRRPNRRLQAHGIYLPSTDTIPQMGLVVIQSDESGSIGNQERAHFGGHINSILEKCRPERVILLHTDTHVHQPVEEFTVDDLPIKFTTYACGGTDMVAGIRWCHEHGVEPEVFITLTDGYTPFPDKDPGFDTVWLITSDQKSPVGTTIPYRME